MELCDSCKKTLCDKKMEITRQGNLVTIRCIEYEKDPSKIHGYKKQLNRTARQYHTLMNLNIQEEKDMKKIRFLVNVPDKYTKEQYIKGQIKEFEDARADEILSAKRANGERYAEEVKEEVIETATKKVKAEIAVKKTRKKKENDVQR